MQSIPKECRPVKGSAGESRRSQQFIRQLPPHDFNADHCYQLSGVEKKRMRMFADRRTNQFYGVGVVEIKKTDHDKASL